MSPPRQEHVTPRQDNRRVEKALRELNEAEANLKNLKAKRDREAERFAQFCVFCETAPGGLASFNQVGKWMS